MGRLDVLDWRRRTADLYAQVRAAADPAQGHARWRAGRDALFAQHPASPLLPAAREGFTGLPVADHDPAWRFEAVLEAAPDGPQVRDVATGTDGTVRFERLGRVRLGDLGTLDVWWLDQYGGGLFLPLADPGPGYGGGRYVLDTVKGADLGSVGDALVVDLNFAYPPSCAHDPAWACPLPAAGNRLDVPVPVGDLSGGR